MSENDKSKELCGETHGFLAFIVYKNIVTVPYFHSYDIFGIIHLEYNAPSH